MKLLIALTLVVAVAAAANPDLCADSEVWAAPSYDLKGSDGNCVDTCPYNLWDGEGNIPAYSPIQLVWTGALQNQVDADKTQITNDNLVLSIESNIEYYGFTLKFPAGNDEGACQTDMGTPSITQTGCDNKLVKWTGALNTATGNNCGWTKTSLNGIDTYSLNVAVEFQADYKTLRADSISTNTITTSIPIQFTIDTQIDVTSNVQVFSPVRLLAAITEQTVTVNLGGSTTLDVNLYTSLQAPFRLSAGTSGTTDADVTVTTAFDDTPDVACAASGDEGTLCNQNWAVQYTYDSGAATCNFNGVYTWNFNLDCSGDLKNDAAGCPLTAGSTSSVTFTLATGDHCIEVVEDISLYGFLYTCEADCSSDYTSANDKDAFLDGQTIYAAAPVWSTEVSITDATFDAITLTGHNAGESVDFIATANQMSFAVDDWVAADGTGAPSTSHTTEAAMKPHIEGTTTGTVDGFVFPEFSFVLATNYFATDVAVDENEQWGLSASISVTYLGTTGDIMHGKMRSSTQAQQGTVVRGSIGASKPASSSSSNGLIAGMSAQVVYGAAAGIALVAIVIAAVVVRRRRSSSSQTEFVKSPSEAELTTV